VHFDLPSQPQGLEGLLDGSLLAVAVVYDLTLGELEGTLGEEVQDEVSPSTSDKLGVTTSPDANPAWPPLHPTQLPVLIQTSSTLSLFARICEREPDVQRWRMTRHQTNGLFPGKASATLNAQGRARATALQAARHFRRTQLGQSLRGSRPIQTATSVVRRHRDGANWLRAAAATIAPADTVGRLAELSPEQALDLAYDVVLHRQPQPEDVAAYAPLLRSGTLSPYGLVEMLTLSTEWRFDVRLAKLAPSLHMSRCDFIQSLPAARRILDLGGTGQGLSAGALVTMGYPYRFDELVIVDLPPSERHETYQDAGIERASIETRKGPVHYRYHSMTDLSSFESNYFHLVYSGESIEHVPISESPAVLREVFRVLRPGGYFALDTPNARVTRLEQAAFIDPDHKYEYTHQEMAMRLEAAGLEIIEAKGLNYAGRCLEEGKFSPEEVATRRGIFSKIEDCYLLTYLCRKPWI
jgi:2-polyprenyl-3-methyl-5-hydroxy-6-metoxy-1,4-benzoquinol methylase